MVSTAAVSITTESTISTVSTTVESISSKDLVVPLPEQAVKAKLRG